MLANYDRSIVIVGLFLWDWIANKIRQIETGIIYDEAIDVENIEYTYEETEEKIDIPEEK